MSTTFPSASVLRLPADDHEELCEQAREFLALLRKRHMVPADGAIALFYAAAMYANQQGHDWPELTRWAIRIADDPKAVPSE